MGNPTDVAYTFIREKILTGSFLPSQKLTEIELAQEIGVSRNTIKKAFLSLESENLLTIEKNRGAFVKSYSKKEINNYLEIREVLEGLVIKSAVMNMDESNIAEMKSIIEKMRSAIENQCLDEYSLLNRSFHNIIYDLSTNQEAVDMINRIKNQLIRLQIRTILVPGRNEQSFKEHQKILGSIVERNVDEAMNHIMEHIYNVRKTINENYPYIY